jgi:hypothetical protein
MNLTGKSCVKIAREVTHAERFLFFKVQKQIIIKKNKISLVGDIVNRLRCEVKNLWVFSFSIFRYDFFPFWDNSLSFALFLNEYYIKSLTNNYIALICFHSSFGYI